MPPFQGLFPTSVYRIPTSRLAFISFHSRVLAARWVDPALGFAVRSFHTVFFTII